MHNVVALVVPDVITFDLAIPAEVFGRAVEPERYVFTHWEFADELAARFPAVRVTPEVLYVDEGAVLTSAGIAAGVDLCLYVVRRDYGAVAASGPINAYSKPGGCSKQPSYRSRRSHGAAAWERRPTSDCTSPATPRSPRPRIETRSATTACPVKWDAERLVLEMRDTCERCGLTLTLDGPAMICSYECTFCTTCSSEMADVCPNCSGRLVLRPPRAAATALGKSGTQGSTA